MKQLIMLIVASALFAACSKKNVIGDYFYMGKDHIIHIDNRCGSNTFYVNDNDIYSGKITGVFCSKCINKIQIGAIKERINKYVPMAEKIKAVRSNLNTMQKELEQKTDSAINFCKGIDSNILWVDIYNHLLDLQTDIDIDMTLLDSDLESIQKEISR